MSAGPFEPVAGGVRVALRVTPRASRNAVAGLAETAAGGWALKVSVTAVPEDGKANEAVVKLLAKHWKLPRSSIALVAGATDRNKILQVAGDPAELMRRLTAALPEGAGGASAEDGGSYG
ncbi:DUF167 domain-containing protein [Azospirillum sp. SYSU D00513]|uniref:DUF167 domain-containing protein n=1 Tax=Azospirillum sp. SYSU D00513 TaxID=2812561 RepID=UPI001A95FD91|nr:DUF167 domain-containing protein [Azospirillum sp. SYSU D00513]